MTNYAGIELALEKAIASLQADLAFLKEVKACQDVVDSYQTEIIYLQEASEIVWQYKELET
jgi:hypothetical protein